MDSIRYTERNPLRARLGARAEEWLWSSAAARGGLRENDPLLDPERPFPDMGGPQLTRDVKILINNPIVF